jgi:hypothetical protein
LANALKGRASLESCTRIPRKRVCVVCRRGREDREADERHAGGAEPMTALPILSDRSERQRNPMRARSSLPWEPRSQAARRTGRRFAKALEGRGRFGPVVALSVLSKTDANRKPVKIES